MLNTCKKFPSDVYGCYWVRVVYKNTLEEFQKSLWELLDFVLFSCDTSSLSKIISEYPWKNLLAIWFLHYIVVI